MRVLLTNDDGIHAPGMRALAARLAQRCELVVICPEGASSASSHSVTLHKPLRLHQQPRFSAEVGCPGIEIEAYSCSGKPSDCVTLGVMHLGKEQQIDLVISGINDGRNVAEDLTYSGTVGAALEGAVLGVPSFAVSFDLNGSGSFEEAAEITDLLLSAFMFEGIFNWHQATLEKLPSPDQRGECEHGWPLNSLQLRDGDSYPGQSLLSTDGLAQTPCLNVNIPGIELELMQGVCWTVGGHREYFDVVQAALDPRGRQYYWLGGQRVHMELERPGTDTYCLHNNLVSVTPVSYDITNYLDLPRYYQRFAERSHAAASRKQSDG